MDYKQTVELFAGTKSFSTVALKRRFKILTLDNDPQHQTDIVADLLTVPIEHIPKNVRVLWASPPCEGFSVAAIGKNWNKDYTPKHPRAVLAKRLVLRTLDIIEERKPAWWFIENPRGMLRKMPFMQNMTRHTITYCQYGDTRQKPTDIWTNAWWWQPRLPCLPGSPCHVAAPRGSRTGTQGIKGSKNRARVPHALFEELFNQIPL